MTAKRQRIGYVRVSSYDQNDARQLEAMGALDRIFTEKASGKDIHRPQLQALLRYAREGDTIVVQSMDRLARNVDDLRQIVNTQTRRGIGVEFIKEHLTFTGDESPLANLMLSVLGGVAQFERDLIRERQLEGIALAKKRGVYQGRKKSLSPGQIEEVQRRVAAGEKKAHLAKAFGISRETLYQYLKQDHNESRE
jgi:DNA invertase Pin-like site-specific DNA recombinase